MNKIIIAGRLTAAPELRTTGSGTEVCGFVVAVDRRFGKKEERQTDFIPCTAWGKSGVFVNTYFHKGDGITVEGRMESHRWADSDGTNRISWGVTVDNIEFPLGRSATQKENIPADFEELGPGEEGELPF